MSPSTLLSLEAVFPHINCGTKKQALKFFADQAETLYGLDADDVFSVLMDREQTGTTSAGGGTAVPQGRFEELNHVRTLAATLNKPIEFGAADGTPVDIVVVLLSPDSGSPEHLKALATVSRVLRNKIRCSSIRAAKTPEDLHGAFTHA